MEEAEKSKLIEGLSKYGMVEVLKADFVFTLLLTGENLDSINRIVSIQTLVLEATEKKYPNIEVVNNTETYVLYVLKPIGA